MSRFMLNQDIFKMLHFFNVNLFILLLAGIILPPTCAGSFANDSDSSHRIPLVINTWAGNYEVATNKAWEVIAKGSSSLDAIEAGITECELNQCGTKRVTVGYGGSPNEAGETTLDALIIDGAKHAVGAVGCLKRVKTAISVARAVMENTRATLLVGEDATQFALQMGFTEQDLHTNESVKMWKEWKKNNCQPNFWNENVRPNPRSSCGPYTLTQGRRSRVGDSPIPGAGAYVDKDVGGAAGTGDGDVLLKFLPSFHAVELLRQGYSLTTAARMALKKIARYYPTFRGGLITVTKDGRHGAASYGWSYFRYTLRNPRTGKNKIVHIKPLQTHRLKRLATRTKSSSGFS